MPAVNAVRTLHRLSGAILGLFVIFHIVNHLTALLGIETQSAVMQMGRALYRLPPVEAVLLAAVVVQTVTGAYNLWFTRKHRKRPWATAQAVSGAYLLFFLAVHTSAILTLRGYLGLDTGFYAAASVLAVWPFQLFFIPYYALGVIAFFVHAACVLRRVLAGAGEARERIAFGVIAGGIVASLLIVAAYGGAFYDVTLPLAYLEAFEIVGYGDENDPAQ